MPRLRGFVCLFVIIRRCFNAVSRLLIFYLLRRRYAPRAPMIRRRRLFRCEFTRTMFTHCLIYASAFIVYCDSEFHCEPDTPLIYALLFIRHDDYDMSMASFVYG